MQTAKSYIHCLFYEMKKSGLFWSIVVKWNLIRFYSIRKSRLTITGFSICLTVDYQYYMAKLLTVVHEFAEFGHTSQVVQSVSLGDSEQLLASVRLLLACEHWGLHPVHEAFNLHGAQSNSNDAWDGKKEDNFVHFGWLWLATLDSKWGVLPSTLLIKLPPLRYPCRDYPTLAWITSSRDQEAAPFQNFLNTGRLVFEHTPSEYM